MPHRTTSEQTTFDNLFKRFNDPLPRPATPTNPQANAHNIGSQWNFNTTTSSLNTNNPQLPSHLATLATTTVNNISNNMKELFKGVQNLPEEKIEFTPSSYERKGKNPYGFEWRNRKLDFDMTTEDAKNIEKKIPEINFEYIEDPKRKNEDFVLQFKLKDKIASDSTKMTDFLNQLQGIQGITAKNVNGIYTITYSSTETLSEAIEKLKEKDSRELQGIIKNLETKFKKNKQIKEILEKTNGVIEEKIETEKKNFKQQNILDPIREMQVGRNFEEKLKTEQKIAELSLLKEILLGNIKPNTGFDSLLKETIITYGADAIFEKMSDLFGVITNATGLAPNKFNDFIRSQFESYNNASVDPLIAKANDKITNGDLSIVKTLIINEIDKAIEKQKDDLGKNLQAREQITDAIGPNPHRPRANSSILK